MANIDDKIFQIRQAVYGKDVRESIASGIEAINKDVETFSKDISIKQTNFEQKLNNSEDIRIINENNREKNESNRKTAEQNRVDAEKARVKAETNRVDEFNVIKTNYEKATNEKTVIELTQARTDNINNKTYANLSERLDNDSKQLYNIITENIESMTIQDNVISIPNVEDGFINIDKIEGDTLVNINKSYWNFTANPAGIMTKSNIEGGIRVNRSKSDTLNWATVLMGKFIGLLKEDTTYSFIFEAKVPSSFHAAAVIQDEDGKNMLSSVANFTMSTGINIVPIKTFKFDKVQPLNQVLGLGVAAAPLGDFDITNLRVLEGDYTNKPIPSYFEGIKSVDSVAVKSVGKNLFNLQQVALHPNAKLENNDLKLIPTEKWQTSKIKIDVKPNIEYRFLCNANIGHAIVIYDKNGNAIYGSTLENVEGRFTTVTNEIKIEFYNASSAPTTTCTWSNIMLVSSDKSPTYEPFKQNKIDILTQLAEDKTLKRLPNGVCDIFSSDGVVNRKIGKEVLNDSLDWIINAGFTTENAVSFFTKLGDKKGGYHNFINSVFPVQYPVPITTEKEIMWGEPNNTVVYLRVLKSRVGILAQDNDVVKKDKFLAWLKNNPIVVYYELAEPIIEKLDTFKPLRCFKGGHIIIESNIPVPLTFRYPTNFGGRVQSIEESVSKLSYVKQTTSDIIYYVSPTGNDNDNGLSESTPFKTIMKAIDSIPKVVNHTVMIVVAEGTYDEDIEITGFYGMGMINILGKEQRPDLNKQIVNSIFIHDNTIISIGIDCFRCKLSRSYFRYSIPVFIRDNISDISIYRLILIDTINNGDILSGIYVRCSNVFINSCEISNKNTAIRSNGVCTIYSRNNQGINNNYGLYANGGTTIVKDGAQPTGTTNEFTESGGLIR